MNALFVLPQIATLVALYLFQGISYPLKQLTFSRVKEFNIFLIPHTPHPTPNTPHPKASYIRGLCLTSVPFGS
ncbi:hypothetical protein [Nostoc sp. UHCC 0302]|uniref:hypothetical protein n=1 Tax=Nostoc sp. UHCC 0302 TaxID=3134896 RepID=UPI00311CC627